MDYFSKCMILFIINKKRKAIMYKVYTVEYIKKDTLSLTVSKRKKVD